MKSIAVIKPDMGVLSRDRLPLSPFGALSQAFGEELLARAEQTEGAWSYVPLDLLEEGEEAAPPAPPVKPVLQVNLQLVLEALRREGRRTEQQRATERIVERILQMQTRPASRQEKEKSSARTPAQPLSVFGTVRQEFHPTFIQNIRISAPPSPQPKTMGELARKAENFSQRLQTLREEGAPPPQETRLAQGQMVPLRTGEEAPRFTQQADRISPRPLPQEALTLLEEQGETAAQTVSSTQSKALLRRADQLAHQMQEVLTESVKSAANPPAPSGKHQEPSTSNQPSRTPQREDTEENRKKGGEPDSKAPAHAPAAQGGQVTPAQHGESHIVPDETVSQSAPSAQEKASHSNVQPQMTQAAKTAQTAARDIRVSPDTPLGSIVAQENFGATAKQAMGQGSAAPMVPGTSMVPGQTSGAPAVSGKGTVPPAPLDLSLRTESEKAEEVEQFPHKISSTVEKTETSESKQSSPPALAQEKESRSSVQFQTDQTPTMPQTGKMARTAPTAARDIRVSPDTPLSSVATQDHIEESAKQIVGQMGAATIVPGTPIAPGTSMAPGQMPGAPAVSGQGAVPPAPLDLSLRTEEEKVEGAEKGEQVFHKTSHAVEKTGTTEDKQSSPPASAQEKTTHSSVPPQTTQTTKTPPTAARDIRVSPDTPLSSIAAQEHFGESAKQTMGQMGTAPMVPGTSMIAGQIPGAPVVSGQGTVPPAPLDLSLRTEGETAEEAEKVEQFSHKTSSAVKKMGTTEGKQSSPPTSAQEKESHFNAQTETVQTVSMLQGTKTPQTAARDIRVSPDTPLGSVTAQEHFGESAKQIVGQMGADPMVPGTPIAPGTSMVPGQIPGAPVVSGQGTVPPVPLDLSLRTEGETAEEAEKMGQIFHKTLSTVEKTGTTEDKQSAHPASAQEKTSHSNVKPQNTQTAKMAPTAARDIRVSPDTPMGSVAVQEYFGAAPKQQTMGQMGTAPMVPGTSMVPGQIPGAPAVSGQGAVPPAPLDLSLRTEGEKAEEVEQFSHKISSTVEKTGTTEDKQSSPLASVQEKASRSSVQSKTVQTPTMPQTGKTAQTAARDIRVSPDTPLSSIAAQEHLRETAKQIMGQMRTAPMVLGTSIAPGTSMIPGQMPGAPAVFGEGAVPPAPLDLSLRTEGEKTEEGEKAGQVFHKVPSTVEKTGTTEGKQSSSLVSPQEKTSHSNVQSEAAQAAQIAATGRQAAQSPHTSRFGTQNHPSPWGPRTAARDIRTGPMLGQAVLGGKEPDAWMASSLPLTWCQPNQEEHAAQPFVAGQTQTGAQAAAVAQREGSSIAEPLSLTYGPVQSSVETPPPEPEAAQPAPGEESEFVRSLPDWARRFLKQSRSSPASHTMGVARDIATVPRPEETEDVQWTAPNYRPPQATIAHREKKQEERPKAVQEVHISEAEIQRTADRVYRIIEDRIRLERRRLGL